MLRVRRPALLRRLLRREGRVPLHGRDRRRRRPRVDAGDGRQRAAEDGRRCSSASPRASRRYELTDEPRALPARDRRGPGGRRPARSRACARPTRGWRRCSSRCSASRSRRRGSRASEKINVIPSRAELKVDCRVPPGLGEEEVRRGIAEVLGRRTASAIEFTEQVVGNRSPMQLSADGHDRRLDRRARPRRARSCR